MFRIETKSVPVDAGFTNSIVDLYHNQLRQAFRIVTKEALFMDSESTLQAAVKAVNDSVGPDGLVPILLVYGALPSLGVQTDPPALGTYDPTCKV